MLECIDKHDPDPDLRQQLTHVADAAAQQAAKAKKAAKEKADRNKAYKKKKKKKYQELKSRVIMFQMPKADPAMELLDRIEIATSIIYNRTIGIFGLIYNLPKLNELLGDKTPCDFHIDNLVKDKVKGEDKDDDSEHQEDKQQASKKKKRKKRNNNNNNNNRGSGGDDDETSVLLRTWNTLKGSISRALNIRFRSVTSQLNSGQAFERLSVLLKEEKATKNEVR